MGIQAGVGAHNLSRRERRTCDDGLYHSTFYIRADRFVIDT